MAEDVSEEMLEIAGSPGKMARVRNFMDALFPGQERSVPDPWYGGPEGFVECWELIEQASEKWIEILRREFKS
jgi:protein-tyrosine phosphatase